jgi:ferritin-like metal-binding protein YciE
MAKPPKNLHDLFHDTLKDTYFGENKIVEILPKMAKAATASEIGKAFEKRKLETETHIKRLEKVFALIDAEPQAKTCDAIMGIINEGESFFFEYTGSPALDSALIAVAQTVEHYEVARYGTLKCWAGELGHEEVMGLFDAILDEEKNTDAALTALAESAINQ